MDLYVINYFILDKNNAKESLGLFEEKNCIFQRIEGGGSRIMVAGRRRGKMENRKRISSRLENLETIVREEGRFSKRNVSKERRSSFLHGQVVESE